MSESDDNTAMVRRFNEWTPTIRNEMLTRVALAIWDSHGWHPPDEDDKKTLPWSQCVRSARAAIRALMEPTESMVHDGALCLDHPSIYMGGPSNGNKMRASRTFAAMLSAALSREEGK